MIDRKTTWYVLKILPWIENLHNTTIDEWNWNVVNGFLYQIFFPHTLKWTEILFEFLVKKHQANSSQVLKYKWLYENKSLNKGIQNVDANGSIKKRHQIYNIFELSMHIMGTQYPRNTIFSVSKNWFVLAYCIFFYNLKNSQLKFFMIISIII